MTDIFEKEIGLFFQNAVGMADIGLGKNQLFEQLITFSASPPPTARAIHSYHILLPDL